MTRTNPPIPTYPMLYRQVFFLPLFLVAFSKISLADVVAFDEGYRLRLLRDGRDVCSIRRLGRDWVRVSCGTAAARAERYTEVPVFRSGDHTVCLEGAWGHEEVATKQETDMHDAALEAERRTNIEALGVEGCP